MLARVQRLEQTRRPSSHFERWFGYFEAFAAECEAGINAGIYDRRDMPCVVASVQKWMCEDL